MEIIQTQEAPAAIGTYSQAVHAGGMVFISGQIPLVPETMSLCSNDFSEQMQQVLKNIEAICRAAHTTLQHIVKLTVYLTDLTAFPLVNEIMAAYFTPPYPARAVIEVSALPKNAQIEIDCIVIL